MKLFMFTQGVKGGNRTPTKEVGEVTLRALDTDLVKHHGEITVDNFSGMGATYKRREQPLINIQFADGSIWSGTFEALQSRLKPVTDDVVNLSQQGAEC